MPKIIHQSTLLMGLIPGIALILLLSACGQEKKSAGERSRVVHLVTVDNEHALRSRDFVGRVVPVGTVDLSFQVGGTLEEFPAVEGSIIPRGELIASLDKVDFEIQVREAKLRLEHEERNLERNRTLLATDAISQSAFDQAESNFQLLEIALERAQRNLHHTEIRAPFDSLVTRRYLDRATLVDPGRAVVRVQDVSELRIHFSVPEDLMPRIHNADLYEVEAHLPAFPGVTFPLVYREHSTEPDRFTQTYRITVAIEDAGDHGILPGLTASVRVRERQSSLPADSFKIPLSAVQGDGRGGFQVWVYQDSGRVSPKVVEVTPLDSELVLVTSGLESGDRIVAAGVTHLKPDMQVTPWDGFQ